MATKTTRKRRRATVPKSWDLPDGLTAIGLTILSLFVLIISLWPDSTGLIGNILRPALQELFGLASPLLGVWLLIYSVGLLLPGQKAKQKTDQKISAIGLILLQITVQLGAAFLAALQGQSLMERVVYRAFGGILGSGLFSLLHGLIGDIGMGLLLTLLALVTLSLLTRRPPLLLLRLMGRTAKKTLPSAERRQKILTQGRVAWQQTRAVAEKAVETIRSDTDALQAEARSRDLMALATEGWSYMPEEQHVVDKPATQVAVRRSLKNDSTVPPRSFDTEGEWWMPRRGLIPDDEVILPGSSPFTENSGMRPEHREPEAAKNGVSNPPKGVSPSFEPLSDDELELFPDIDQLDHFRPEPRLETHPDEDALETIIEHSVADLPSLRQPENIFAPNTSTLSPTITGSRVGSTYLPPPLSILAKAAANSGLPPAVLVENSQQLEQTLELFGVKAKVVAVTQGPTVTRYELQLAPGTRVNRVASLSDDIALSLAAMGVRIEAPIPGKSLIGIEVPNKETRSVMLSEILTSKEFATAQAPLTVALGMDISGKPIVTDLNRMPHLLIAGTTGSGKSVCMNSLICSILYRCSPDEVRLIMVDPKVVEMSNYNGIPHLLAPVVTDARKAAGVLKKATMEMDRRYELFASLAVKNIGQYNERIQLEGLDLPTLPFWVLFIDELADLMLVAKADVEQSIMRISQLARAAGIHLVIGTQRPTTDVITGIIKGNVPSRIAFAVSSSIDSRIILDANGAEKLLSRGDMLFQPLGSFQPTRIQGAYISEKEIDAVVAHVKMQGAPVYDMDIILDETSEEDDASAAGERDSLFMQAAELVVETQMGSTSYLQRRLRVGYSRAGRIMDQLCEHGIVGPPQGSKSRDVLMSREQLEQIK